MSTLPVVVTDAGDAQNKFQQVSKFGGPGSVNDDIDRRPERSDSYF